MNGYTIPISRSSIIILNVPVKDRNVFTLAVGSVVPL